MYNINIDYKNIPTNRRALITDEVQEISNLSLPLSQKSFVQYKTRNLTNDKNNIKITNQYQFIKLNTQNTILLEDLEEKIFIEDSFTKEEKELYKYTIRLNLNEIKCAEIKTNKNIRINTNLTSYTIEKDSKTIDIQTENKTTGKTYFLSDGKPIKLHFIGYNGIVNLILKTNNKEYFKELITYV